MATEPIEPEVVAPQTTAEEKATQAIEKRSVLFDEQGIQIKSMADAMSWGKAVIDSGLAPKGFRLPSQVIVAVQTGAELGLKPAASLRAMYMTPGGKAALYAEAALALCMRSGLLVKHRHTYDGEGESLSCTFYVLRKGDDEWKHETFSVAQARRAQLVKPDSNWEKWPKRMVLARARAFVLHDVFADALLGVPVEGDLDDLDVEPPAPPESRQPPPGGFGLLAKIMPKEAGATAAQIVAARDTAKATGVKVSEILAEIGKGAEIQPTLQAAVQEQMQQAMAISHAQDEISQRAVQAAAHEHIEEVVRGIAAEVPAEAWRCRHEKTQMSLMPRKAGVIQVCQQDGCAMEVRRTKDGFEEKMVEGWRAL